MNNWNEAAADAAKAMVGYTPYTPSDLARPTFQDGSHGAWIWGCIINESDLISTGNHTWQGWLGSLNSGYTTRQSCYARCNVELYKKIPATDVRKGWWVDENLESPLINDLTWPGQPGNRSVLWSLPNKNKSSIPTRTSNSVLTAIRSVIRSMRATGH